MRSLLDQLQKRALSVVGAIAIFSISWYYVVVDHKKSTTKTIFLFKLHELSLKRLQVTYLQQPFYAFAVADKNPLSLKLVILLMGLQAKIQRVRELHLNYQ